jgi:hypothetical protein
MDANQPSGPEKSTETAVCILTGKSFPFAQMVQTEHGWVSAEARERYYESLREGVPLTFAANALPGHRPEYRLFTVGQITLAAFLGSPLPGFWMISQNFRALGRHVELRKCWMLGIGLTVANLAVAFFIPEGVASMSVSVPFVITVRWFAHHWLAADLAQHRARGGALRSWWATVGYGLAVCAVFIAIAFAIFFASGAFK